METHLAVELGGLVAVGGHCALCAMCGVRDRSHARHRLLISSSGPLSAGLQSVANQRGEHGSVKTGVSMSVTDDVRPFIWVTAAPAAAMRQASDPYPR